jgi:hypothetical protein
LFKYLWNDKLKKGFILDIGIIYERKDGVIVVEDEMVFRGFSKVSPALIQAGQQWIGLQYGDEFEIEFLKDAQVLLSDYNFDGTLGSQVKFKYEIDKINTSGIIKHENGSLLFDLIIPHGILRIVDENGKWQMLLICK